MIALIDYGSGNLRSVENALKTTGATVSLTSDPATVASASGVVLPGVGAFGDCVRGLQERGLWEPVQTALRSGQPFLGICVGYQMLFEGSEESPGVAGLGWYRGMNRRFKGVDGLKVPQIGWNCLETLDSPLWKGLPLNPYVYFVHSYFPVPADDTVPVIAWSCYGERFAAAAGHGSVWGVQFHPEKSQTNGLRILANFVAMVGDRARSA